MNNETLHAHLEGIIPASRLRFVSGNLVILNWRNRSTCVYFVFSHIPKSRNWFEYLLFIAGVFLLAVGSELIKYFLLPSHAMQCYGARMVKRNVSRLCVGVFRVGVTDAGIFLQQLDEIHRTMWTYRNSSLRSNSSLRGKYQCLWFLLLFSRGLIFIVCILLQRSAHICE